MPFLSLNGLAIPIEDPGASMGREEIGDAVTGAGGTYWKSRIGRPKRRWRLNTVRLPEAQALPLEGLLRGDGFGFTYDTLLRSSSGLGFLTGVATLRSNVAADGLSVIGEGKFKGSMALEEATTNLLPIAEREASSTASFVAFDGAVLAVDTSNKWQGAGSVSATTSAVINATRGGLRTGGIVGAALTAYTGSVYVRKPTGAPALVGAFLRDITNGISGPEITVLADNNWRRLSDLTLTTGAAVPTIELRVLEGVADAGFLFLVDGLQIEAKNHSTSWVSGARAAGSLQYPGHALRAFGDLSFNAWLLRPNLASIRGLLHIQDTVNADGVFLETAGGGANTLNVILRNANGLNTTLPILAAFPAPPAFAMLTLVIRKNPKGTQTKVEVWINGVFVAAVAPAILPNFDGVDAFYIGSNATGSAFWSGGLIDDPTFCPYALSPEQIAAAYASGVGAAQGSLPTLLAMGDIAPGGEVVPVMTTLADSSYLPNTAAGVFAANARALSFEMWEV